MSNKLDVNKFKSLVGNPDDPADTRLRPYVESEHSLVFAKVPTIGAVIETMISSVENPPFDCEIDMSDFGSINANICYGCAATYTVAKVIAMSPDKWIRTRNYHRVADEITSFEFMINNLRQGVVRDLIKAYLTSWNERVRFVSLLLKKSYLNTDTNMLQPEFFMGSDYKQALPHWKQLLADLKAAGF